MTAINKKETLYSLATKAQAAGLNPTIRELLEVYSATEVDSISGGLYSQIIANDADILQLQTDSATISGDLDTAELNIIELRTDVDSISGDLNNYTLLTETANVTAALQNQITSNDVDISDLRTDVDAVSDSIVGFQDAIQYGSVYIDGSTTSTSVSAGSGYSIVSQFATDGMNGESSGSVTPAASANNITLAGSGIYYISGSSSFTSDTNNVILRGAIFLDGVEVGQLHFARKISSGADLGSASFSGLVSVDSANETIDLRLRHDAVGAVAITMEYANISAFKIN